MKPIKVFIVIFLATFFFVLFSCKAKKKTVEKKVHEISKVEKKDLKTTTKTEFDVSVLEISETQKVEIEPVGIKTPITVVFPQKDTFSITNGKITISQETTVKATKNETETKTRTKDKTKTKTKQRTKHKTKHKDVKGGFPWWVLLVIAAVFLVWKFGKNIITKLPGI